MISGKKRRSFEGTNRGFYGSIAPLSSILLFFALLSINSYAVQIDSVSSSSYSAASLASLNHKTGSGSDMLMLVTLTFNNDNGQKVKSVTYNNIALTKMSDTTSVNDLRIEFWSLKAPPVGTYNIQATFSALIDRAGTINVITLKGVDQLNPLGIFQKSYNQGGTKPPSISLSAAQGDLVIGVAGCESCTSLAQGSGQTELWNMKTLTVSSEHYISAASTKPGASTVTLSWTQGSNDHWTVGAVPVKPSATATSPAPDTTPPSVPLNLLASAISSSQISLSWFASSDAQSGISFYEIYRGGIKIGQSTTNSYLDSNLNPATAYSYDVLAVNGVGLKSASSSTSATTNSAPIQTDTTPPSVPLNLLATPKSPYQIFISWAASTDGESAISFYEIYRDGIRIAQTSTNSYSDYNLDPGTQYNYQVLAVNVAGLKSQKASVYVTTSQTLTLDKIPGDLNGDGIVGNDDAQIIVKDFGKTSGFDPRADTNKDGVINIFDLMLVGVNWLRTY